MGVRPLDDGENSGCANLHIRSIHRRQLDQHTRRRRQTKGCCLHRGRARTTLGSGKMSAQDGKWTLVFFAAIAVYSPTARFKVGSHARVWREGKGKAGSHDKSGSREHGPRRDGRQGKVNRGTTGGGRGQGHGTDRGRLRWLSGVRGLRRFSDFVGPWHSRGRGGRPCGLCCSYRWLMTLCSRCCP